MKKALIPLAAATLLGTQIAHAQSSVTLYGLVDIGLNYFSNTQTARPASGAQGGHVFNMEDGGAGGLQNSRWGLRGTEDLGGGLKALFDLENGFTANNGALGQGGLEFGRGAYVGLAGNFGTVTLGRQAESLIDYVAPFDSGTQWGGILLGHGDDIDTTQNSKRVNNSIKYQSVDYSGFSFNGLYSLGGVAGDVTRNQLWSVGAGYNHGPFRIGAAYMNSRNPNISFFGTAGNSGGVTANNLGSTGSATAPESNPVYAGYASARSYTVAGLGTSYTLGQLTLGAAYSNIRFDDLGADSGPNPFKYSGNVSFNDIEVNVRYMASPTVILGASYNYLKNNGLDGSNGAAYGQVAAGVDYILSARTDVYMHGIYQHASGTDSLGQAAVASLAANSPSTNDKQFSLRVGIRHKF